MSRALRLSLCSIFCLGCGDDVAGIVPVCDEIDWPLGVEPLNNPPPPEYAVECADGWGNSVATRPALDTVAMPGPPAFTVKPHPAGGWVM